MGDPHHIAKVDEGVEVWNDWQEQNPRVQPNLTRSDLSGSELAPIQWRKVKGEVY